MGKQSRYFLYRIRLEKLKHKTWTLIFLCRILLILAVLLSSYLR
jgi:hypothetical protein